MPRYTVTNTTFNDEIGIIHWRGGWRQYVFMAHSDVDMSRGCNLEVNAFIDKLMDDWKKSLKRKK